MIVESYFSKADKLYVYFQLALWVELLETAIECTVMCIGCVQNPFRHKICESIECSAFRFL
jgi:diacylglycerol kinase